MQLESAILDGLGEVATEIADDYEHWREPFNQTGGITTPITNQIDGVREKGLFLTLTSSLNRQRDAERLFEKFERLYYDEHWIFEPETLIEERDFEELVDLFEREGTRYGQGDAEVWYEIALTLYEEYDSDVLNLLEECDYNMQKLEERVRTKSGDTRFFKHGKRFPVLKGDKIRPLWLRLISRQVHRLENRDGSDVSVDTHLIQITNHLLGTEYTNDEADKARVREFWRDVCDGTDVQPVDIDGPLWYINRNWSEWGRAYVTRLLRDVGLELQNSGIETTPEKSVPDRSEFESEDAWIDAVADVLQTSPRIVYEIREQAKHGE